MSQTAEHSSRVSSSTYCSEVVELLPDVTTVATIVFTCHHVAIIAAERNPATVVADRWVNHIHLVVAVGISACESSTPGSCYLHVRENPYLFCSTECSYVGTICKRPYAAKLATIQEEGGHVSTLWVRDESANQSRRTVLGVGKYVSECDHGWLFV